MHQRPATTKQQSVIGHFLHLSAIVTPHAVDRLQTCYGSMPTCYLMTLASGSNRLLTYPLPSLLLFTWLIVFSQSVCAICSLTQVYTKTYTTVWLIVVTARAALENDCRLLIDYDEMISITRKNDFHNSSPTAC